MANVSTVDLPATSRLHARIASKDFIDCYSVESSIEPRQAAEIIADFPGWAQFLLSIRKVVTTPFGLSNDGPVASDKVGVFPVESETNTEIVAGFNDKHLNFRVSVISEAGRVYLGTWVHTHNIGGQIYLAAIMPFHIAFLTKCTGSRCCSASAQSRCIAYITYRTRNVYATIVPRETSQYGHHQ
jgi:hypothetical protein